MSVVIKDKLRTKQKRIRLNTLNLFEESLEEKKLLLLKQLQSKGLKNRYKRYLGSPLRYAGGKSLAVGYILEYLPTNIKRIISPFFGGGSFEIACAKELQIEVIGFDIFDILVNYWKTQINQPLQLYNELCKIEPTKENYYRIKKELEKHWKKEIHLNNLTLATYYYFNHNLSYGPGFLGWMSSVYEKKERYRSMINKVKNFKVKNLSVTCKSFEEVIPAFKNDFLYLDPPYYLEGDSKMFTGIYPQRNFPIHHKGFNHELLKDLLLKHKGQFILSYNDCSTIRNWYKDFKIIEVQWQYTMGQGETRIGKNRIEKQLNHVKDSHELLIIKE